MAVESKQPVVGWKGPLGIAIRKARKQAKLSQHKLALKLKCSKSYICHLERGTANYPPKDRWLKSLADEVGIDASDLILICGRVPPDQKDAVISVVANGGKPDLLHGNDARVFSSEIAQSVGLNEAIALQKIGECVEQIKASGVTAIDGHYWVIKTAEEWQKEFPWWSLNTVKRVLLALERDGLILTCKPKKNGWNHTKAIAINPSSSLLDG